MRQIVRRVIDRRGRVRVIELPEPHMGPDQVLVQSAFSLISSGTEMSTLGKTPAELVRQTIADPWMRNAVQQTVLSAGPVQTARRVWHELVKPREIGYSGAGRVLAVGREVRGIGVGDRVAYAAVPHAEIVAPSRRHVVRVPERVDFRDAAFVTVGAITVHALRRADAQFGETIAVFGLGLLGQICCQVARAAGCVVIGIDVDDRRNELAAGFGADLVLNPAAADFERRIMEFTGKHGVDATVICASSDSSSIINQSMAITRKQGRVVIVGYVNLDIHPKNFLYNEIDLRYSRAYGPGSYDRAYEHGRVDYPFGYVRWTEERNLEEFIRLLDRGSVRTEPLVGGVFPIEEAQAAFDAIRERSLQDGVAVLLDFDGDRPPDRRRSIAVRSRARTDGAVGVSIVGCGNHALSTLVPALKGMRGVEIRGLVSATGMNAIAAARGIDPTVLATDIGEVLADPGTDAVLITSAQHEHFDHLRRAIEAGKAIYLEKPMVMSAAEFGEIGDLMDRSPVLVTLGLNRRYSPLVRRLREALDGAAHSVTYTIAETFIPPDHRTLDEFEGGGRLVSEGEHFIDICHFLIGREPLTVLAQPIGPAPDDLRRLCNFAVTIRYESAVAHIVFDESRGAEFPRERIQVMAPGKTAMLDDFSRLVVHGRRRRSWGRGRRRRMGHAEALSNFVAAVRGDPNELLGWEEAARVTLTMFAAQESIRTGEVVDLREFRGRLQPSELTVE